ncbi:hypothetical protein TTHERM_00663800 (macronuclear) [Tetrahymena thermophila SB210]|uniref:Uncharacterized protein n=1 Tax=Tetrahymena thermophila (strain SB210) TaxID=312017 RepID=I7M2D5_TETTS|nr:hypothetical protein TTHERM_00663800 [Tetrahymena thermophila SB210]EAR99901.1 hypothetical protein TTHERM_00663800 [Tetrahymena thermophila SB210]|eukprot:XP_001020146.1 hypothetical protein TTHERM_00663800 [Tetrahymena thermophila SB210]
MNKLSLILCLSIILVSFRAESEFNFEHTVEIIEGEQYIQTPYGLMLKECVQNVPSGTFVEELEDGSIHLTNDQQNFAKKIFKNDRCSQRNPTKNLKDWIDSSGYYLPVGFTLKSFEGNYTVPNKPQTNHGQVLYYFIGSQNNDGSGPGTTIVQPVLTYNGNWIFQSWNCCPQGQAINASPVSGINPQDSIHGSITVQNNVVNITSTNKAGNSSVLSVAQSGRNFNWIDATLEVYYISACTDFPNGYLEYTDMKVVISDGETIQPAWYDKYGISECNGSIQIINPSTIKIQHYVSAQEQQ